MCVKRLSRVRPVIQLSSFREPELESANVKLFRVPVWPDRQGHLGSSRLRLMETNPCLHLQPRLGNRRIIKMFQQ